MKKDLKHFQEGFNSDFGKKLLHVLDLGKFQVESVGQKHFQLKVLCKLNLK